MGALAATPTSTLCRNARFAGGLYLASGGACPVLVVPEIATRPALAAQRETSTMNPDYAVGGTCRGSIPCCAFFAF